ncbi:MAG: flagellar hook-basal body complex protein FliE [Pseudomonadota bacterium]
MSLEVQAGSNQQIQSVLAQMRALRAQAQQPPVAGGIDAALDAGRVQPQDDAQFGKMLKGAIDQVNDLQKTSSKLSTQFMAGEEKDLVKVMIAGQKSSLGFQALLQVRNRMVSAYQDIMNMPI